MLWILATIAYLQVGFQLGKKSVNTWKKGDTKSLESFLMFPVRHARGTVGKGPLPFMPSVDESSVTYRALITLFWPLMLAWNGSLVLGLLGPDKVITRMLGKGQSLEERFAQIEREGARADRTIRRLEAPPRPRKQRAKKGQAQAALPAPAAPQKADAQPPNFVAPPPVFAQPPPSQPAEPAPARTESVPPPVQVRVTVDVTAPGHATDADADAADAEPESAREPEPARAAEHDRIVH